MNCKSCGKEIKHTGKYWEHVDYSPRHIATPDEMTNIIPEMTDKLGHNWVQPATKDILIDNECAIMNQDDFDLLKNYSTSQPSGVYEGKMWVKNQFGKLVLCWYKNSKPGFCSTKYRDIVII